jgi:hypothetical protein
LRHYVRGRVADTIELGIFVAFILLRHFGLLIYK